MFEQVFEKDVDPESYVEEHGLKTVNDEGALEEVLKEIIAKNLKVEPKEIYFTSGWTDNEGDEGKGKSWNGESEIAGDVEVIFYLINYRGLSVHEKNLVLCLLLRFRDVRKSKDVQIS